MSLSPALPFEPLSLALSGGGVKCAAQVGVLAVLEEAGLPVGALAGTSGGGMVAILYGLGHSPRAILDYIAGTDLLGIWDLDPTRSALFGADKIRARVHAMVGDKTFADLKIPVTAVATDLRTRREVHLNSGPLEDAMLATMAIPTFFAPVLRGEAVLVDGGMVNPLPVDVARQQGPRVVAVDVVHDDLHQFSGQIFESHGPLSYATEIIRRLGLTNMLNSAYEGVLMFSTQLIEYRLRAEPPDLLLQPAVGTIGMFAFDMAYQAYEAGAVATRAALPQLEVLALPDFSAHQAETARSLRRG